tara:strand:+ start:3543 stop:4211 length:669 start_codon:yes stop_codon:yes gene_type:complete
MNLLKIIVSLVVMLFQLTAFAAKPESLYVAIASSGPGGAILGHSYLVFCQDPDFLRYYDCVAYEFNLEINQDANLSKLKNLSLMEKLSAFVDSPFRVYKHEDVFALQKKYVDRGQTISYMRYSGSSENIKTIHSDVLRQKSERELNVYKDYEISDNNCATKIIELLENAGGQVNIYQNHSFYDFDQYLSNFPIVLEKNLKLSGLFDSVLEVSNKSSRAYLIK